MSADCVIQLEHVWTRFGDQTVHRDISLCVQRGEIMGLVGGSGSGKTTLLREMVGLHRASQGAIKIFGHDLSHVNRAAALELKNRCGVLFQSGALFSSLNVFDNIAVPLREADLVEDGVVRQLVCMKLCMVGLPMEAAGKFPAELSGGMVKRAALARALALEPELLFLDEPTAGLDPVASDGFVSLLCELHEELGFTVVMVTHDLDTLRDVCDRVSVLADGELIAVGTLPEVTRVDHPFIRTYFHGRRGERALAKLKESRHG